MIIQHNLSALNSHRQLGINNSGTAKNLEKLSSGFRINRAADDAAGLAISEKMRGQIRGLDMATQNAQNGISLIQTAEGGLNETHAILQRMRELSVQSANGTYQDDVDRANLQKEMEALSHEITRIADSTHYNNIKLLDGSIGGKIDKNSPADFTAKFEQMGFSSTDAAGSSIELTLDAGAGHYKDQMGTIVVNDKKAYLQIGNHRYELAANGTDFKDGNQTVAKLDKVLTVGNGASGTLKDIKLDTTAVNLKAGDAYFGGDIVFQIGANGAADQEVSLRVESMSAEALLVSEAKIDTRENAKLAIGLIDEAINTVSGTRADLGALQNRLEHTVNNLGVTRENLQAAESSIRDVDMAKEMMEFTKNNILVQASQAMLAQANALPQGVLSLLR